MATNERQTKFPLPKNELYYWDESDKAMKPVPTTPDGKLMVHTEIEMGGNIVVDSIASKTALHTFHNANTAVGAGASFDVGAYKTMKVEIYGTSTAREVKFFCMSESGVKRPIAGTRVSDYTIGSSTTNNEEIWEFDIAGLQKLIMEVVSVTGGNLTIKGKAVA